MLLDIVLYAVGLGAVLVTYLPFSPATIDLVLVSRETQISIYRRRRTLWTIAVVAGGIVLARAITGAAPSLWLWIVAATAAGLAVAFWSGYVPVVMSQPSERRLLTREEADRRMDPDDTVLGLAREGQARAYLRDQVARPHRITDEVAGSRVTVSYCILCNSAMGFRPEIDGEQLDLQPITAFNNNILYHDSGTGNIVQQLDGRVIAGPDEGRELDPFPVQITSWEDWKELHPDTELVWAPPSTIRERIVAGMLDFMVPMEKLVRRSDPFHRLKGALDRRLPAMSTVLGVEIGDEARAYPIDTVAERGVVNDTVGGEPLGVVHAPDTDVSPVFRRRVGGRTLTFSLDRDGDQARLRDQETGTRWGLDGRGLEGELADEELELIPYFDKVFWFSWAAFKPHTDIYGEDG